MPGFFECLEDQAHHQASRVTNEVVAQVGIIVEGEGGIIRTAANAESTADIAKDTTRLSAQMPRVLMIFHGQQNNVAYYEIFDNYLVFVDYLIHLAGPFCPSLFLD